MASRPLRRPNAEQGLLDFELYFADVTHDEHKSAQLRTTTFKLYQYVFRAKYDEYITPRMQEIQQHRRITINYQSLRSDITALNDNGQEIHRGSCDEFVCGSPASFLAAISCAVASCYFQGHPQRNQSHTYAIKARLINFDFKHSLKELRSNFVDRFVVIRGTAIRVSGIKPMAMSMDFECRRCGAQTTLKFPDGRIVPITECPSEGSRCKAKQPQPLFRTAKCIDLQTIRVQELSTDETGGRVPRIIDVELTEDLVDACVPGDVVTVSGIVCATKCEAVGREQTQTLYQLYIKANALMQVGHKLGADLSSAQDENSKLGVVEFTEKDLQFIAALLTDEEDVFRTLVNSICPSIYGHEMVKAGLLLTMCGGNSRSIDSAPAPPPPTNTNTKMPVKDEEDDSKMSDVPPAPSHEAATQTARALQIRGDIHMLIVGDPGLGKSQMLRAVARIAPRGVYVSGNTTSVAGLTVTMIRDGGDTALEAGALVMGDQGVCCIDEFDKMGVQQQALLEAMEQQSISIAKSGMVCTLSARTSVIAAANPCGGHYDPSKTIPENIKMSGPLLSRFDLLFLLLDKSDKTHDSRLSTHVLRALDKYKCGSEAHHKTPQLANDAAEKTMDGGGGVRSPRVPRRLRDTEQISNSRYSLQKRLQLSYHEYEKGQFAPIPECLLRKYIVYARKYCHPKMAPSAKRVLLNFYLSLRQRHQTKTTTPITTRQLESLIRLAQARAKVELREVVTADDALDVVELMKASMYDALVNEEGRVDFKRSKGCSMPVLMNDLKRVLNAVCKREQRNRFTTSELKQILTENGFPPDKLDKLIDVSNQSGTLLIKKGGAEYEFPAGSQY